MSKEIDWANLRVTRSEMDATLRDSVNKFYEHQKNDPSITNEEAIQSTAEMAEGYLNCMEGFDAAQSAQGEAAQTGIDAGTGVSGEGGISGGAEGGMSGGMGM